MTDPETFMARVAHRCWVSYQLGAYQPYNAEPTRDQLDSLIAGARSFLARPSIGPAENHDHWMAYKLSQGWIWGPVKDPERKEHPNLVPYAELPEVERRKDEVVLDAWKLALELWRDIDPDRESLS